MYTRIVKLGAVSLLLTACTSSPLPVDEWQRSLSGSYAIAFSPDRRYVLVGDTELPAKLWDVQTGEVKYSWQNAPDEAGTTTQVAFSGDSRIAATCESKTIMLWDVQTGKPLTRLQFPVAVNDIAISPQGDFLFLALQDRSAVYFDVVGNRVRHIFNHDGKAVNSPVEQPINAVAISPNGKYGLTGGDDYTVRLWRLEDGQQLRQWQHSNHVTLVDFDPLGGHVISSAANDQTYIWNAVTGNREATLTTSPIDVDSIWADFPVFKTTATAVAYSADRKYIATGHPSRKICLWHSSNGKVLTCWHVPRRDALNPSVVIQALMFSENGRFLYSESGNGFAQKWAIHYD